MTARMFTRIRLGRSVVRAAEDLVDMWESPDIWGRFGELETALIDAVHNYRTGTRRHRRTARSWLAAGAAIFAAAMFLWALVYLGETFSGPRTVPVEYTPSTAPRSAP